MLTGSIRTCRVSSVVNETIKTISSQFIFSRKDFEREKNANQPKPIKKNKPKISEQKNNKGNGFLRA